MSKFLKKIYKRSKKPGTPENPITGTDAAPDSDSEGEYRSRDLRADKAAGTDSTLAPDNSHGGGAQTANLDGGDAGDVDQVHSGKSRGGSRCSGYTIVRVDHY